MYFDIQITNEDPTNGVGRQTVILKDCNLDGGILAKFDADAEMPGRMPTSPSISRSRRCLEL